MDFLGLERTPFGILIGLPTMIQLQVRPDYYRMVLNVHYGGDSEILNYECERDSGYTSEYQFTSDSAIYDKHEEEDSIEELVLMLNEPQRNSPTQDECQLIEEKLSQLNEEDSEAFERIVREYPEVIANSFEDVRPSTVSATHRFELTSDNPICQKARRMSPSHNEIVRKEIDRMLTPGDNHPSRIFMDFSHGHWHEKRWISTILCRLSKTERSYACGPPASTPCRRNTGRFARELGILDN